MNTSLTCVWIALLVWQPAIAEFRQAKFNVLQKGTRPSNGRSISTQSGGTETSCAMMCLSDPSCTSVTLRKAGSCQTTCELRDQSGVNDTLFVGDSTASYYTQRALPCDCSAIQAAAPGSPSGVYDVKPISGTPIEVYCDMDTDGGGWLVFQKRVDGSVDFYLKWTSYAAGFGNLNGEFWLGNCNLHLLTAQKNYTLRVVLGDWEGNQVHAQYYSFTVGSEQDKFRLTVGGYSGTAGDSLSYHSGRPFSARDQDNDAHNSANCAQRQRGAWWYGGCSQSNLNGRYYPAGPYTSTQSQTGAADGVWWAGWKGTWYSFKSTRMMVRPAP